MATIKAFKGLRYSPKAGHLGDLCCPPYDIISEQQRMDLINKNEYNIIRLELPKDYDEAGRTLSDWLDKGILADDDEESIYVYEFTFEWEKQILSVKGFVPLVKLHEFSENIVLPHEETLSKAKTDRFNLMTATGCNFSQIYSLYSDADNSVQTMLESVTAAPPTSQFTDGENVKHSLWKVSNTSVIEKIAELMADKQVFIADGHHRYETALNYKKSVQDRSDLGTSEYVPMMLVSMENTGLAVFPTHRIVRDLSDYNYATLIEKSKEYFDITENLDRADALAKSHDEWKKEKNAFVLYSGDNKYTLMSLKDSNIMKTLLPNEHESLRNLDVSVLHSLVLERIFGIDKANMAAQINLTYVKIADDAVAAVDNKTANCCFLLNATRISEIRDVSLAGGKMPQKSTYFYPKLTTGLVMNRIFKD